MSEDASNPGNPGPYVTEKFCNERFSRVIDKLNEITGKLDEINEKEKGKTHFVRDFLGTLIGGGLVAYFAWLLSTFVH